MEWPGLPRSGFRCTEATRAHPGPDRHRFTASILVQKPLVLTPGMIVFVYSIDLNTEAIRTHPGPDRLRLQYRI